MKLSDLISYIEYILKNSDLSYDYPNSVLTTSIDYTEFKIVLEECLVYLNTIRKVENPNLPENVEEYAIIVHQNVWKEGDANGRKNLIPINRPT